MSRFRMAFVKGLLQPLRGVVWDWGDTLMRDFPEESGTMAEWSRVEAMPGAAAALEALSSLGVQCVATNAADSDGPSVARALDRVGLRPYLTRFFTSLEMGVRKPDPAFFETVAQELGIPPEQLLAVGNDLRKDIAPAKAAGMVTILVGLPAIPESEAAAHLVVSDLIHLTELVAAV